MLNKYALDNPTLPANLRFHHLFKILAERYVVLWETSHLLQVLHGGIGTKDGRAHENNSFFAVGLFTIVSNLLQPTECVNSTLHTSPFSRSQRARVMMCDTTLAQVLVRVIPFICHAPELLFVLSFSLTFFSSVCFSIFHFFFLNFDFYLSLFHVDAFGARSLVNNTPLT